MFIYFSVTTIYTLCYMCTAEINRKKANPADDMLKFNRQCTVFCVDTCEKLWFKFVGSKNEKLIQKYLLSR